jgi:hypothetical protein
MKFEESGVIGILNNTKVFLGGGSGIENPVDIEGTSILEGDILSWNYGGSLDIKDWMLKPVFKVHLHHSGKCLCGLGIDKNLYLHDFEFKNCKKINE